MEPAHDSDLLQCFVHHRSDDAFRSLVERHSGMVHGAALRLVRDESLAQEVTQAVFLLLVRKAGQLPRNVILAGWLHRTARFVALQALRAERRRQQHREQFACMNEPNAGDSTWNKIAPLLEEGISRLGDLDRAAVVLRFLEEKSFAEVAAALGTTEPAAKMRVSRALDKLRHSFARQGVVVPGAVLAGALTQAVSAAPAGLSQTVFAAALTPPSHPACLQLVQQTLVTMAWNKTKSAVLTVSLLLLLGAGGVVVFHDSPPPKSSAVAPNLAPVASGTLQPLAGDWAGTFQLRADGSPDSAGGAATLHIIASPDGRSCAIDMRVASTPGSPPQLFQFSHTLHPAGDRLTTIDDPQIASMNGEGLITENATNAATGEWRLGSRTPHAQGNGESECLWVRQGDSLQITRRDRVQTPQGLRTQSSELLLHRAAKPSNP